MRRKPVTHAIYPSMEVGDYQGSTVPMLIADLGNQHIILGMPWMNEYKVMLDIADDRIIFISGRGDHRGASQANPSASSMDIKVEYTAVKPAKRAKPAPPKTTDWI